MFDVIKQMNSINEAKAANQPEIKFSLWDAIRQAYRAWNGKRKFAAVAKAKREEKAIQAAANNARADALEAESNALVMETIGMKDMAKVDELLDLAGSKLHEAETLRQFN